MCCDDSCSDNCRVVFFVISLHLRTRQRTHFHAPTIQTNSFCFGSNIYNVFVGSEFNQGKKRELGMPFLCFLAITTTMFTDIELIITRLLLIHSPACCHVTWGFTVGRPKGNGLELFSG